MDSLQVAIWVLGGAIGVIGILVGVLWNMTRAEQKAQDEAIKLKADKLIVEEAEKRSEKEFDRIRFEHEKVISRVEGRFEKELENVQKELGNVENRVISRFDARFDALEANSQRQFEILIEMIKKEK